MNSRRELEEIYTARDDADADEFRAAYEETRRSYEFGVLTRTLRKAAGLTQKELATRMAPPPQPSLDWKREARPPPLRHLSASPTRLAYSCVWK